MCCIVANLLKIVIVVLSVFLLLAITVTLVNDLEDLRKVGSAQHDGNRYTIWLFHCFCGTLMTVLKLKEICFLHWWLMMTFAFIIGGFCANYLQPAKDGLGMDQKVLPYFVLEYMVLTLLQVAAYTRALRSQEEV